MSVKYPDIVVYTTDLGSTGLYLRTINALLRNKVPSQELDQFRLMALRINDYNYVLDVCAGWVTIK